MNPVRVYELHRAVQLHFKGKYDAVKYQFKVASASNPETFLARKDRYHYVKISRKFDLEDDAKWYIISHFVYGNPRWIGEIAGNQAPYEKWMAINESFEYFCREDINRLAERVGGDFNAAFRARAEGSLPPIVAMLIDGSMSCDTAVVLNRLTGFAFRMTGDDLLWPDVRRKILRYDRLAKMRDMSNIRTYTVDLFNTR